MFLVTGATGFVGKNLLPVIANITRTKILARKTSNIEPFEQLKNIEIVYGNLANNEGLEEAMNGVDVVIHCAARTIGKNFSEYYRTNVSGTAHLLKAMKRNDVKKILYLSSHAVCGPCSKEKPFSETDQPNPISFYGATKKIAEDCIISSGLQYIILRPVAVYGPYDMDILKYIKLIDLGLCPIIGFNKKFINLIYIADLVGVITSIIRENDFDNQIYFVSDGNCYSMEEVLAEIAHILNRKTYKIYVPEKIALFIGLLNDIFVPQQKRLVWRDKVKELAKSAWLCCNDKLKTKYNFTPAYDFKQGLAETINWYRENGLLKNQ